MRGKVPLVKERRKSRQNKFGGREVRKLRHLLAKIVMMYFSLKKQPHR
jgi:hypothetical protein